MQRQPWHRQPIPSRRQVLRSGAALALLGATACSRPSAPIAIQPRRPFRLYLGEASPPKRLLPLDPLTLADPPARPAVTLTGSVARFSADGSTLVEFGQATKGSAPTIVVRQGPNLAARVRLSPPAAVSGDPRLSRDGRTLVLSRAQQMTGKGPQPDVWDVFDTSSGQLRATVKAPQASTWNRWWIDPAATRLYQPLVTWTEADTAPRPLQLVAYDLATGTVAGRLALPHVLVGTWRPGGVLNGDPVIQEQYPALTLSPDGAALVIYQPDRPAITIVEAAHLMLERTVDLHAPPGALAAALAALPLWPRRAEAKSTIGANLQGSMAPDRRSLYVWGDISQATPSASSPFGSIGLRRVDLQSGAVAARTLPAARLFAVLVAPDGRSVYTYASRSNTSLIDSPDWPALLRRHDATTLAVTATREFTGYRDLLSQTL